jgi:hypothetical protein
MSDYPMLISNKLHSFRNFIPQIYLYSLMKYTYVPKMKCFVLLKK